MLFKVLKRAILRHQNIDELEQKLDIFLAADKLTIAEYEELISMISDIKSEVTE